MKPYRTIAGLITVFLCFLGIILAATVFIGCSKPVQVPVSQTNESDLTVQVAEDDLATDEQLEQWRTDSYRPVIEKWLKGEKLPQHVDLVRNDQWASPSERGARVELLDVNGDGDKELAMQSFCSAVGNCAFWLYQKDGKGFKHLLDTSMVQRFKLRRTKSNGYYDLETSAHDSAISGGIAVYKFSGSEYKISECFGYEYELTGKMKNGQAVPRDKPTLTPADCEAWPGDKE